MVLADDTLATLYAGALGRVEYLTCSGRRRERGAKASSSHLHIVLPLSGSFVWHPGKEEIFADSTTAIFAGGGEDFAISHPAGGDRSLVIWPNASTSEELTRRKRRDWRQHPAFAARKRRSTNEILVLERAFVAACTRGDDTLAIEDTLARLLALLVDNVTAMKGSARGASNTVARTKSLLQQSMPDRLTLAEIARAVGVSPIYLTQLFRASEGVPLYQYALGLRMAAALDQLGRSEDITALAMDLGFSSHSHFTAAFRRRFGAPPSALRSTLRAADGEQSVTRQWQVRPLCSTRGGTGDWLWS